MTQKKKKKKTHTHTHTHTHMQIHRVLQFPSMNFLILKLLLDNLIINVASYISFKILVKLKFSWTFFLKIL